MSFKFFILFDMFDKAIFLLFIFYSFLLSSLSLFFFLLFTDDIIMIHYKFFMYLFEWMTIDKDNNQMNLMTYLFI